MLDSITARLAALRAEMEDGFAKCLVEDPVLPTGSAKPLPAETRNFAAATLQKQRRARYTSIMKSMLANARTRAGVVAAAPAPAEQQAPVPTSRAQCVGVSPSRRRRARARAHAPCLPTLTLECTDVDRCSPPGRCVPRRQLRRPPLRVSRGQRIRRVCRPRRPPRAAVLRRRTARSDQRTSTPSVPHALLFCEARARASPPSPYRPSLTLSCARTLSLSFALSPRSSSLPAVAAGAASRRRPGSCTTANSTCGGTPSGSTGGMRAARCSARHPQARSTRWTPPPAPSGR